MGVAAPLIAADGRRFGIVIADLDLRPVFDRIRATARQGSRIYVVNDAGDFLLHPDPNREFGFQRGSPARVQDDYPALMEFLQSEDATPRVLNDRSGERFGVAWQKMLWVAGRASPPSKPFLILPSSPERRRFAIRARSPRSPPSSLHSHWR
jgi:hypothetical protein